MPRTPEVAVERPVQHVCEVDDEQVDGGRPGTGGRGRSIAASPAARSGSRTPRPRPRQSGWTATPRAASALRPPPRPGRRCPPQPARTGGWLTRLPLCGTPPPRQEQRRRTRRCRDDRRQQQCLKHACLNPSLPRRSSHQSRRIHAGRCRIRLRPNWSGRQRVSGSSATGRCYFSPSAFASSSRLIVERPGRSRCLAISYSSARLLGAAARVLDAAAALGAAGGPAAALGAAAVLAAAVRS